MPPFNTSYSVGRKSRGAMKLFRRAKDECKDPQPSRGATEPQDPPAFAPPLPPRAEAPRGQSAGPGSRALSPASLSLLREVRDRGGGDSFVTLHDERGVDLGLVEDLRARGLVEASTDGRVLRCPKCLSSNVKTFFACPQCGSRRVNKGTLHVHRPCGGFFTEPRLEGGRPLCPVCGAELREGSYGIVGAWFECENCGRGFEEPGVNFTCASCSLDFDVRSSRYDRAISVRLSERGKELLRAHDILKAIQQAAAEEGYRASLFTKVTGASGVGHEFDVVLDKGERKVAVELIQPSDVNDTQKTYQCAAELLAKSYDLPEGVEQLLVVDGKGLCQHVHHLLERPNVRLVEGSDEKELVEGVRRYLRERAPEGGRRQ